MVSILNQILFPTSGHVEVVKLLLKAGSNPNAQDAFGVTPIDRATSMVAKAGSTAQKYKWEIIKLLMTASETWVTFDVASRVGK